jgi:hypothetical protein
VTLLEEIFPAGFPPAGDEPLWARAPALTDLFGWADLERILATGCFEGPGSAAVQVALGLPDPGLSRVCVLAGGRAVWRVPRRVRADELRSALRGATLRVEAVEDVHSDVAGLVAAMSARAPAVYANAYAAWGSEPGLALHYDYTPIVVLQVSGRKAWSIYRPTRPAVRGPASSAYKEAIQAAERGEPGGDHAELERVRSGLVWDGELGPGDALYLPPGWFHRVRPVGEPTLQLSCAFSAPGESWDADWDLRLPGALKDKEA